MREDRLVDIKIDPSNHVPIYLQIVEGVRAAIACGTLRAGEPLPSLRSFAIELKVNPNTVQRAFDELERAGVVYPRRGLGMYVAERRRVPALDPEETAVVEAFQRGIEIGRSAQIKSPRLRQLFGLAMKSIAQGMRGQR
jgi:GntR family transcriptional regulator